MYEYDGEKFNTVEELEEYLWLEWSENCYDYAQERGVMDVDYDEFYEEYGEKYVSDILNEMGIQTA